MAKSPLVLAVFASLGLTACVASPPTPVDRTGPATAARWVPASPPVWGDDDNSPVIKGVPFWELHLGGQVNAAGFKYTGFRAPDGTPLTLAIRDARMVGLDASGQVVLDTPGMTHATLEVTGPPGTFQLLVVELGSIPFWAGDTAQRATTYYFQVQDPIEGTLENLCRTPPDFASWPGGNVLAAMVFAGDRYPDATQVVNGPATTGWFNLACAGTAIAKMHLVRHTESAMDPQFPNTTVQRRSMLRMFTSAVCTTRAFTFMGEPIRYVDRSGFVKRFDDVDTIEAIWTPAGAACLDVHRLVNSTFPDAPARLLELSIACPQVPSCSTLPGFPTTWRNYGFVLSANPIGS